MRVTGNEQGTFTATQRLVAGNKVGFICEGETMGAAISGMIELIAEHCAKTGTNPAEIITEARYQ